MSPFAPRARTLTGRQRAWLWGALAAPLLAPLVAMQFSGEVKWDQADFAAAAALMIGLGVAVELAFRLSPCTRTRAMEIGAAALAVLVIWADAAVGVF